MLKKFFAVAFLCMTFISSTCLAISANEFSIGGVYLNMPYNDIIKIYGQPTSRPGGYAQLVTNVIKYGSNVEIGFLGDKVRYAVTTADNGFQTPSGVRVGLTLDSVINILGRNYTTESRSSGLNYNQQYFYADWTGTKYTWSQVSSTFMYSQGDTTYTLSVVVNDDKVTAVEINQITPEY